MKVSDDVARSIVVGWIALSVIAARGTYLSAHDGGETLAPMLWPWAFGLLAGVLVVHVVMVRSRAACLASGVLLHACLLGRLAATKANSDASTYPIAGRATLALSLYAAVLLSSALVWRYLLWPSK